MGVCRKTSSRSKSKTSLSFFMGIPDGSPTVGFQESEQMTLTAVSLGREDFMNTACGDQEAAEQAAAEKAAGESYWDGEIRMSWYRDSFLMECWKILYN